MTNAEKTQETNIVDLVSIQKSFDQIKAVNDVSIGIKEGEFFSLLGPSGCGKTTLLRIIAGFEVPEMGSVLINQKIVNSVPPNKRPTNMVFQNYAIFPHLSVADNVGYGLRNSKLDKSTVKERVKETLNLVGLEGLDNRSSTALSGGQRQRVALARALILKPRVLLLDEPLSALDKNLREQMQFELRQLQKSVGITFVLVTHDQTEALTMSDRVGVMFDGNVDQVASPEEIYNKPRTKRVASFIGSMNFFDTEISGITDNSISAVNKNLGEIKLKKDSVFGMEGSKLSIGIRPEKFRLIANDHKEVERAMTARVYEKSFLGETKLFNLKFKESKDSITISTSDLKNAPNPQIGDEVKFIWDQEDLVGFFEE